MRLSPPLAAALLLALIAALGSRTPARSDGRWTAVPLPHARSGHTTVVDPARDRLVVFGGYDGTTWLDDVWVFPLFEDGAWTRLVPAGPSPSPRSGHCAVFDPERDRMVIFGGEAGDSVLGDAWALSFASGSWAPLAATGDVPSPRTSTAAVLAPDGQRMIVLGGWDGASALSGIFQLSLTGAPQWSEIVPSGPAPAGRYGHSAVVDPFRNRAVVFGGWGGTFLDDAWALSLSATPAWSALGPAGLRPPARVGHAAVYDMAGDRVVMCGGENGDGVFHDTWALSLSSTPAWSALDPAAPPLVGRRRLTATFDPARLRMVTYGGDDGLAPINDLRVLSLTGTPTWEVLGTPTARRAHAALFDPTRDRMLVLGGDDGTTYLDDVWALALSVESAWSPIRPTGTPPSPRVLHSATYDPVRDRVIVFGGRTLSGHVNDVWTLGLSGPPSWSPLVASGAPPPVRRAHSAIYDPVRDRLIVFGGYDGVTLYGDVWELSFPGGATWTQLAPLGAGPAARYAHAAIFEPGGDRMVVFGGRSFDGTWQDRNDVWALSLAGQPQWSPLDATASPPSGRSYPAAIFDPIRGRLVTFGGLDHGPPPVSWSDTWAMSLSGAPAWSGLYAGPAPAARFETSAVYDEIRDRMVVFGGYDRRNFDDTWTLDWNFGSVSAPEAGPQVAGLVVRPNPARRELLVEWALPAPARVEVEVLDLAGRRVARLAQGWLRAGRHGARWAGTDADGRSCAGGVYFLRLRAGEAETTRRVAWLP